MPFNKYYHAVLNAQGLVVTRQCCINAPTLQGCSTLESQYDARMQPWHILTKVAGMHHVDKGHGALKHSAALKGLILVGGDAGPPFSDQEGEGGRIYKRVESPASAFYWDLFTKAE